MVTQEYHAGGGGGGFAGEVDRQVLLPVTDVLQWNCSRVLRVRSDSIMRDTILCCILSS